MIENFSHMCDVDEVTMNDKQIHYSSLACDLQESVAKPGRAVAPFEVILS